MLVVAKVPHPHTERIDTVRCDVSASKQRLSEELGKEPTESVSEGNRLSRKIERDKEGLRER